MSYATPHAHCTFSFVVNKQVYRLAEGEQLSRADFTARSVMPTEPGRTTLLIIPHQPLVLGKVEASLALDYQATQQVFCNGFQSWSESRWYSPAESIPALRRIAKPLMGYYGDYHHRGIPRGRGHLHSWSWTCLENKNAQPAGHLQFWASLCEKQGFTRFEHHLQAGQLVISRDCEGLHIQQPFVALDWLACTGLESACFDQWFACMDLPPARSPTATGWTSWYHYYTHISEKIILDNLKASTNSPLQPDFFQIDDGWQTAVGDWLSARDVFPQGMAPVAEAIRGAGAIPGLWLAPFVADQRAKLPAAHPDWIRQDLRGRPLWAGYSPPWGGRFYALDTTHPGVKNYLAEVFSTVLDGWGFGLLKLDFLYAACLLPTPTHTRGRLMYEAMSHLRELAGDRYLLGCGLPLASGFGLLDYCRIGADIHLSWEHALLRWLRNRERVSTLLALRSVLGRWALDGRAWRNDPDVFLLRENNLALSDTQKTSVLRINTLLGGLLFTSDPIDQYHSAQRAQLDWLQAHKNEPIQQVSQVGPDLYQISTAQGRYRVNLSDKSQQGVPAFSCVQEAGTNNSSKTP